MATRPTLVLGTKNKKKAEEMVDLFQPLGIEVQTLSDFSDTVDVVEDGVSFAENAALKANQQARHLHHWVLGEDSGIVVDALDGAPGIRSARFAGEHASDEANNQLLIESLADVPFAKCTAHYTCHMSLADPEGRIQAESESYCHGRIRRTPAGQNGFGYDPLFEIIEYRRTFGELGPEVKRVLSHRARATAALLPQLRKLLRNGQWPTVTTR